MIFRGLSVGTTLGTDEFWKREGNYDVIVFQWPEELFSWRPPAETELESLESTLKFWSGRSKIVLTRHNIEPHINSKDIHYGKLYELMYAHADAVVHLGEFSRDNYLAQYSSHRFTKRQEQAVIPHPVYTSYENTVSKEEARSFLNIHPSSKVILVFGRIRNDDELALINSAFGMVQSKNAFLLISHYPLPVFRGSQRLKPGLEALYSRVRRQRRYFGDIPKQNIQYLLNASDMLFIPRIDTLNSGNVFLGFAYHRPVVGPDITNIGPVLKRTRNNTFDPRDTRSAARAIDLTIFEELSQDEIRLNIANYYPSNTDIGSMYVDLFSRILEHDFKPQSP